MMKFPHSIDEDDQHGYAVTSSEDHRHRHGCGCVCCHHERESAIIICLLSSCQSGHGSKLFWWLFSVVCLYYCLRKGLMLISVCLCVFDVFGVLWMRRNRRRIFHVFVVLDVSRFEVSLFCQHNTSNTSNFSKLDTSNTSNT